MFEETDDRTNLMDHKSKLRAIAMFILHMILEKRVSLLKENDIIEEWVDFKLARKLVNKRMARYRKLLKGKGI